MEGGQRYRLTAQGDATRIDHELEMRPKGAFLLLAPTTGIIGRKIHRCSSGWSSTSAYAGRSNTSPGL
ncbi:MAG TPA: hypothetical protein VIX82_06100 [Solirubrobacteraceae bacterium]